MRRLRGCLDGLPVKERRVLVLRAGLGPQPPRSRARVARELDLTQHRVGTLEHRGLRRLHGLSRSGCGTSPPAPAAPAATPAVGAAVPGFGRALAAAAALAPVGPTGQIEVKGEQAFSAEQGPEPALAPRAVVAPAVAAAVAHPGDDGGASDLLIASLLLVALGSIAFGARGVIRSLRRG